jgi:hypothetical protein
MSKLIILIFSVMNYFSDFDMSLLTLTLKDFKLFINEKKYNSIYKQNAFTEIQNMDLPLNKYFINSSHNTYLTQDQLFGTFIY